MSPRQFVLRRIKSALIVFMTCLGIFMFLHANEKYNLTTKAPEVKYMENPPQNSRLLESTESVIIELTNLYKK